MGDENFWSIIDNTKAGDKDTQSQQLKSHLSQLSKDELIAFEAAYREKLYRAYDWDLWAAAYIINGGCSDDGFDYFCDWLISRGQEVYEAALKNPETLIDEATPWDSDFEEFRYIMMDVMGEFHQDEFPKPTITRPAEPAGVAWDEETVDQKYPALSKWVNSKTESVSPPASLTPPEKPLSFWQRLFGKK